METKPSLDYLAGFFDGEGTICIQRGSGTSYFVLTISVVNTDRLVLDAFHELFGGHLSKHHRDGNHKDIYQWTLQAKKADKFLRVVGPRLRMKQPQVRLAREFRKLGTLPRGRLVNDIERQRAKRDGILAERQSFHKEMAQLNKRGIA